MRGMAQILPHYFENISVIAVYCNLLPTFVFATFTAHLTFIIYHQYHDRDKQRTVSSLPDPKWIRKYFRVTGGQSVKPHLHALLHSYCSKNLGN
jgi:hypothetical protein